MLRILPGLQSEPDTVNGKYEEGHDLHWFMAELWMACSEDLPDYRRQLLQTVKECFRQILKVSILAVRIFKTQVALCVLGQA